MTRNLHESPLGSESENPNRSKCGKSPNRSAWCGDIVVLGIGAILGTLLAIPFLARKNGLGFIGPLVGAILGALWSRARSRRQSIRATVPVRGWGRPVGVGLSFLILSPIIAGACCYYVLGEPTGTAYFSAVVSLGLFVGVVGFIGSMFLSDE